MGARIIGFLFAVAVSAATGSSVAAQDRMSPSLRTAEHREIESLALSLRNHPEIQAAREAVVKLYEKSPSGRSVDGKSRLQAAVDELIYGVLLSTVSTDPAHPKIVWNETLPYRVGKHNVPGSRYAGDTPDRIYRNVVVDPAYRYELRGELSAQPPLDFSFEALPGPGNWGLPPLAVLQAKNVDVADDGSFIITIDATPTDGRRNHLQIPPGTIGMLIRDTVADWGKQRPNKLAIKGLDNSASSTRSRDAVIKESAEQLKKAAAVSLKFFDGILRLPINQLNPYVRDLGWGVVAINRITLQDDEALLVTIDPVGARYFGLQIDDLWLRSAEYADHCSSLNNLQAKPNADGSFTFVVAKRDPGYYNWIDTDGMNDAFLVGRWEMFQHQTTGDGAVREVRVLKLSELAAVLPADSVRVTTAERKKMLALRKASYQARLIQKNLDESVAR